jgi:hypothetical protein
MFQHLITSRKCWQRHSTALDSPSGVAVLATICAE